MTKDPDDCPACDGLGQNMDDHGYDCPGCGGSGNRADYDRRQVQYLTTSTTAAPSAREGARQGWPG